MFRVLRAAPPGDHHQRLPNKDEITDAPRQIDRHPMVPRLLVQRFGVDMLDIAAFGGKNRAGVIGHRTGQGMAAHAGRLQPFLEQ